MKVLDGRLSVCRLPASARVPSWALELHEGFMSITRTPDELSIVCPEESVPPDTTVEEGFRALVLPGPIPFTETGVLASLATPLAAAGISIFAVSTYDTDYVLVRETDLEAALAALDSGRRRISSGSPFEPVIGFSRAVRVGDRVLVSGTGPVMPDGGCPASTYEQAMRCWEIVLEALTEAGASAADVVRTRTFLTPSADPDGAMQAHGEVFSDVRPASTMLNIHSLLDARWTSRSKRRLSYALVQVIAAEARCANELDGGERRRAVDVEAGAVAFLDRRHRGLLAAPGERPDDREARGDPADLRRDEAQRAGARA